VGWGLVAIEVEGWQYGTGGGGTMSVDSVAWAAWGLRWRRFGGLGCGWGGALDRQRGYYGLGMGVGCDCVQGVANVVA